MSQFTVTQGRMHMHSSHRFSQCIPDGCCPDSWGVALCVAAALGVEATWMCVCGSQTCMSAIVHNYVLHPKIIGKDHCSKKSKAVVTGHWLGTVHAVHVLVTKNGLFCYKYCESGLRSTILFTLNDLPGIIITDISTGPLLKKVKLCPTDEAIAIKVHTLEHLLQSPTALL